MNEYLTLNRVQYGLRLFTRASIFKSSDFVRFSGIPGPTAKRILNVLKNDGIIKEIQSASGRRAASFAYVELLNIAEGDGAK